MEGRVMQWTMASVDRALREVRDQLIAGTLPGKLDMREPLRIEECGTIACIGGWMLFNRFHREHPNADRYDFHALRRSLRISDMVFAVGTQNMVAGDLLDDLFFHFPAHPLPQLGDCIRAIDRWLGEGDGQPIWAPRTTLGGRG